MLVTCLILLSIVLVSVRRIGDEKEVYSINQNLPIRGILVVLVVLNHLFESAYMLGNIAVSLFFYFWIWFNERIHE